jgi:nucleotide-binding universal stress UspA family protein
MAYRSIVVSLDIDAANESVAGLAADLAGRSGARLVGVAAASVPPPTVSVDGMVFDAGLMQQERQNIETRLEILRQQFEQVAAAIEDREWRGEVDGPTRFLLENSRAADLVREASAHKAIPGLALSMNADLVVSGAYGHSRIRELIFGGVTKTLLGATSINRLMSS